MKFDVSQVLQANLSGRSCVAKRNEHDWMFEFGGAHVVAHAPWRLVGPECLLTTSYDHGQWYGLPAPINVEDRANAVLEGLVVSEVSADEVTGDLRVSFSNGMQLEIWNNSSGHEGWLASIEGRSIVALGSGGFSAW